MPCCTGTARLSHCYAVTLMLRLALSDDSITAWSSAGTVSISRTTAGQGTNQCREGECYICCTTQHIYVLCCRTRCACARRTRSVLGRSALLGTCACPARTRIYGVVCRTTAPLLYQGPCPAHCPADADDAAVMTTALADIAPAML